MKVTVFPYSEFHYADGRVVHPYADMTDEEITALVREAYGLLKSEPVEITRLPLVEGTAHDKECPQFENVGEIDGGEAG